MWPGMIKEGSGTDFHNLSLAIKGPHMTVSIYVNMLLTIPFGHQDILLNRPKYGFRITHLLSELVSTLAKVATTPMMSFPGPAL